MASAQRLTPADLAPLLHFVSHELRNPLGAIAMWLHLCGETDDPAERARALAMIENSVETLTRLTAHLGDCAALLEPAPQAARPATGLRGLARAVVASVDPAARRLGVTLDLDLATPGDDVRVNADPDRLARGLESLVRHAVLERAPGSRLELRLEVDPRGARLLVPLGADAWSRVRPLREQLRELSSASGASGLALAIAVEIIASYGGELSYREAPGGGQLLVQLPRAAD